MIGNRPRTTRIRPPALTTKRLLMPVMATSPTFWAKALWVKELKTGEMRLEIMSARSPLPMRLESTSVSTISPTARMSAVVSVRMTSVTISIEMMAGSSKVGQPKAKGAGKAKIGPLPMPEKSAMPVKTAISVPMTMASRMDRREMVALPSLLSSRTTSRVTPARPMLAMEP